MRVARSLHARLWGLMLRSLRDDSLFFPRCRSVHTFGMRKPIDLAFVDRNGVVLEVFRGLPPCRIRGCRNTYGACERIARDGVWLGVGDCLILKSEGGVV